ncbi:MAG: tetratricopeptide repeat protein [Sphingobacteriales bacterium]
MIRKYPLLLLFLLTCTLSAKANFNFDANCTDAYKAILSLKMNEARLLIQKEKAQNPQNGITVLLDNYIDYFSLLASESKIDYERLKDNRSARLSALEDNDSKSPYYLFSQAEVYIQWSFLKARFGDYVSSALDAKKASNLLKDNAKKFPDFLPDRKSLDLVDVVFGSIPASFKSITRFLGMSGNVQSGIKQLEALKAELPKTKYSYYNNEVIFFICSIDINVLHNLNDYTKLIDYLSGMDSNSLLKAYLQGYVASKTAHNDDAINFLEAAPKSNEFIKLPAIDYLLGCAKLNRLDNENPSALFAFVKEFRGTNYIKDVYLKIAYYYLLQNDPEKYASYIKMVKSRGYVIDEKDQLALSEANDVKPDIELLKARFYFDGGYYSKALAQLTNKDISSLKLLRDKTEYYYRLGRIYDKTDKIGDAVLNYQRAINLGKATHYYYSANAALSIGRIYEVKRDYKRAGDYYNQALDMHDHQYQTDIDNDAKAGLKRIGE